MDRIRSYLRREPAPVVRYRRTATDDPERKWRSELCQEMRDVAEKVRDDILSAQPGQHEARHLNSIYRGVHTIAGGARLFKLDELENFAFLLERLLIPIRDGRTALDPETVELLLEGTDAIAEMLDACEEGRPLPMRCELGKRIQEFVQW